MARLLPAWPLPAARDPAAHRQPAAEDAAAAGVPERLGASGAQNGRHGPLPAASAVAVRAHRGLPQARVRAVGLRLLPRRPAAPGIALARPGRGLRTLGGPPRRLIPA